MPTEDTTPAIINSAKPLVRTTGTGASLGTEPPNVYMYKQIIGYIASYSYTDIMQNAVDHDMLAI